jgi:hypothetical protein
MSLIDSLVSFVTDVWNLKESLNKAKRDQRERIAKYFENIRDCIIDVVAKLRIDQIPHGSCAEMEMYAKQLPDLVHGVLKDDESIRLQKELYKAHLTEKFIVEIEGRPDRDAKLAELEESAGRLKAIANYLHAK